MQDMSLNEVLQHCREPVLEPGEDINHVGPEIVNIVCAPVADIDQIE